MMTIVTMMIMMTIFINDNHNDHFHPKIHLGNEPGDDYDNHICHSLYPGFDSGENHVDHDNHDDKDNHNDYVNHDDHDNKDDHHTLYLCYEPGDEYGDHLHQCPHSWYDPGEVHDNHDNYIHHNLHLV